MKLNHVPPFYILDKFILRRRPGDGNYNPIEFGLLDFGFKFYPVKVVLICILAT